MADNRFMNTAAAEATQVDLGLRSYMLGVYNHMTTALLMTGFFAYAMKWSSSTFPVSGSLSTARRCNGL